MALTHPAGVSPRSAQPVTVRSTKARKPVVRTGRGYERAPSTPSREYESDRESSLICLDFSTRVRVDQLVDGYSVVVAIFHPILQPDPEDRGEPLLGPTTPDDSPPPAA